MTVSTSRITSVNPATEEILAEFESYSDELVDEAVAQADRAFRQWRAHPVSERMGPMRALAKHLRGNVDRYARLITLEMGKPIVEAKAEIEKCALGADYYAENAERFLADEPVKTTAQRSLVAFQPLGVVLAVMPWNYPFWQVVRFAAPALMAGNGAVLKHASNVPQCALAIEEAMAASGFPEGLFRTILVPGAAVERLVEDPRIRAVTLTGSSDTGSRIAALAGAALKKTVLELGGSDPFIVLPDADIELAASTAAKARNQNTGQSCIAAKRFLVAEAIADDFTERFADAVRALKVGDPLDENTQIGPLARADLRDALERQVRESVRVGARIVVGGRKIQGKGFFWEPTVLDEVTEDMPVIREETFGPVAAVLRVKDADDALRVANDSAYGLGASLWTRDVTLGQALAKRIESGSVFVNGMVASDPRLPFGGTKRSGYGRELSSFGIREFTNIQTIWIGPADSTGAAPVSATAE
ncbi:MAG: NAD-dependent succinate-semialdehyde dehydrogenase [Candidatus Limnocylindria bacterium]